MCFHCITALCADTGEAMVNDTIANALDTIQCQVVPYDIRWDTGISIPVHRVEEREDIFPVQRYDWHEIEAKIQEYVDYVIEKALETQGIGEINGILDDSLARSAGDLRTN